MFRMDTGSLELIPQPPMHIERAYFKALVSHSCQYIYAIGGCNASGALKSVERFDLVENRWELVAPLNTPRYNFACHSCLTK